mmetsp:Transcript_17903/g.40957  ORF Transcript_17903/g.40957 Transcript_17903/m.40957 type:complete len:353 (+) Transcript_17903:1746-2804(+)
MYPLAVDVPRQADMVLFDSLVVVKVINVPLDSLAPVRSFHTDLDEVIVVGWAHRKNVHLDLVAIVEPKYVLRQIQNRLRIKTTSDESHLELESWLGRLGNVFLQIGFRVEGHVGGEGRYGSPALRDACHHFVHVGCRFRGVSLQYRGQGVSQHHVGMGRHSSLPLKVVEVSPSPRLCFGFAQCLEPVHVCFEAGPIESPVHYTHSAIYGIGTGGSKRVARSQTRELEDVCAVFIVLACKQGSPVFVQILRGFPRHGRGITRLRGSPLWLEFVFSLFGFHHLFADVGSIVLDALLQSDCFIVVRFDAERLIDVRHRHISLVSQQGLLGDEQEAIDDSVPNGIASNKLLKDRFD